MAKMRSTKTPYGSDVKVTLESSNNKLDMKNYYLSRIELTPAENGTIVECAYRMKESVNKKMQEKGEWDSYPAEPKKKYLAKTDEEIMGYIEKAFSHLSTDGKKG